VDSFWDWALLELLVQSGLRIEEASELTTLDILKRKMPDCRIYYLLHIKPSKFDRARVIPIGDGLGRVLAEIIRYVKHFYNSESVSALRSLGPPREAASPSSAVFDLGIDP
jgi:site-specific recombinase XerD